ncbi:hypothetical protein E4T56_gene10271 [Termitomyces sp. T112]|nr:hypothetical protein E4T56_gene10271 [Termitomyces sp. T112]
MRKLFNQWKLSKPDSSLDEENIVATPQQHAAYPNQLQQGYMTPPPHSIRRTFSEGECWEVVPTDDPSPFPSQYQVIASHNSSFASLLPGTPPPIPSPNGARSPSPFAINSKTLRDRESQPQQHRKKSVVSAPVASKILGALDPAQSTTKSAPEGRYAPTSGHSDSGHREREKDPPEKKEQRRGFWNRGDRDKDKDKEKEKEISRAQDGRDRGRDGETAELTRMIDWALVLEVTERVALSESNAKEAARTLRREFKYGDPIAQPAAARLWAFLLRNVKNDRFDQQSATREFTETLEYLLISPRTPPVVRERLLAVVAAAAFASGKSTNTGFRALWNRVKPHDQPEEGMPLDDNDPIFTFPVSSRCQDDNNIPQAVYQEPSPFPIEFHTTLTPRTKTSRKHKTPESRNRIIPLDEDIRRLFQECKLGQGNASLLSRALVLSTPEDLKTTDVIKASAEAEKSRVVKNQEALVTGQPEEQPLEQTIQEKLLDSLLSANAELMDALHMYEDLERVAIERMTEVSRKETKMDRRRLQQSQQDGDHLSDSSHVAGRGDSEAPHMSRSRRSSPMPAARTPYRHHHTHSNSELSGELVSRPWKALGKQRVVEEDTSDHYGEENILDGRDETYSVDSRLDPDDDRSTHEGWLYHRPQQHFVYDAVAERTQQRILEGQNMLDNVMQQYINLDMAATARMTTEFGRKKATMNHQHPQQLEQHNKRHSYVPELQNDIIRHAVHQEPSSFPTQYSTVITSETRHFLEEFTCYSSFNTHPAVWLENDHKCLIKYVNQSVIPTIGKERCKYWLNSSILFPVWNAISFGCFWLAITLAFDYLFVPQFYGGKCDTELFRQHQERAGYTYITLQAPRE